MFYREVGQFKTSYTADSQVFPILQDKIGIIAMLVIAYLIIPLSANDFFITTVMIPFLVFSLATIGLNILVGYTGQLSLGTGAFCSPSLPSNARMISSRVAGLHR